MVVNIIGPHIALMCSSSVSHTVEYVQKDPLRPFVAGSHMSNALPNVQVQTALAKEFHFSRSRRLAAVHIRPWNERSLGEADVLSLPSGKES